MAWTGSIQAHQGDAVGLPPGASPDRLRPQVLTLQWPVCGAKRATRVRIRAVRCPRGWRSGVSGTSTDSDRRTRTGLHNEGRGVTRMTTKPAPAAPPNAPSKTDKPSGKDRGNNPPKK